MAPKSLPSAKIKPSKLLPTSNTSAIIKKISAESIGGSSEGGFGAYKSELGIVKRQVIKVKDLIASNILLKKVEDNRQIKLKEQKKFKERENKLEKPKEKGGEKIKLPEAPKLSFLDRIKKFLFNILLGYIVVRLIPQVPKLIGIVQMAGKALDFIIDWGGKLLNGLVTFVDLGYKAYDATRGFIKNLGGEDFAKGFDKFLGAIDTALFLTTALAGSMAIEAMTGDDGRGYGGDQNVKTKPGTGGRPKVTTSGGKGLGKPDIRNPLRQKPKVTTSDGGSKLRLPKGLKAKGGLLGLVFLIPDLIESGMLVSQGRGKDGIRTLISAVSGVAAGMAAYAAVIAGAAALGITGVGIPAAIALAVAGLGASYFAGEAAYNLTEAGLRKMGLVDNDPKTGKPYAYKGGGITRGGKYVGDVKRNIKKTKVTRQVSTIPPKLKPGSKTGGENKINKIFPKSDKDDTINPLGYIEDTYDTTSKIPYFGPIFAIATKTLVGDKPSTIDYKNAATGLNSWMNNTFSSEVMRTGGFASGGKVNSEMFMNGKDLTNVITKSLEENISKKVDDAINNLMKQLGLKPSEGPAGVPGAGKPGSADMINIQGGDADFWTLVAIASREDGEPQAWADVAQSIYNRLASGAYSGKTIKDLILGQMQYEPTWKYPKPGATGKPNSEWYSIKDAASAGVAAGQSEEAMKKVAAAILDPTLQKNAREFIQGRTDFRGYSVSGGVQRKPGDNYYGWYNNYTANKIGSVPNFGATASTGPGPTEIALGKGYGSEGSKIAGELGRFIKTKLKAPENFSQVHRHPEHPPYSLSSGHSRGSLHYQGRAIDIGANADEQAPILKVIAKFNQMKGIKPVQLLHAGNDADHRDHVHVAYGRGGLVRGMTKALLGERGIEFVLDTDTTTALERNFPGFLSELNKANYDGAIQVLRNYASYEVGASMEVVVERPEPELIPVPIPIPKQNIISSPRNSGFDSSYDFSYKNG